MVYDDWSHELDAETNHQLDDTRVYAGSTSLQALNNGTNSAEVLQSSLVDSPNEGRVESYSNPDASYHVLTFFARFQDSSNFYFLTAYADGSLYAEGYFAKVVGGAVDQIELQQFFGGSTRWSGQLSDGGGVQDEWNPFRVDFWEDDAGDFRARLEEDADGDDSWTQIGSDFIDGSPDFGGGGGLGVGSMEYAPYGNTTSDTWYDETEIYY